jgi:ATP-binding cassette subfamily B protein
MTAAGAGPALRSALLLGPRVAALPWTGTIALSLSAGVLAPLGAWVTRSVIDALGARHIDVRYVIVLAILGTAAGAAAVIIGSLATITAAAVQRRMILHVTSEMYTAVNQFHGLTRFETPQFQDSMRLADGAGLSAATAVTSTLLTTARSIVSVAGYVYVLFIVWPPMAALLLVIAIPSFLAQVRLAKRAALANRRTMPSVRKSMVIRSMLTEPRAAKEIRLFGLGDLFRDRMIADLDEVNTREYLVTRKIGLSQAQLTAVAGLAVACGAAIVADRAGGRRVGIGDFVLFLAAVATIESVISSLAYQLPWLGSALILYQRYLDLLASPDDIADGASAVPALRESIELQDVWFRYQESSEWVLRGVSLIIRAGSSTGLVGLNGAGKTTLVKLLCRFYDPARGRILWDGTDIRDFDVADLRKRITATFQDFVSYDLSAAECIGIGDVQHLGHLEMIRAAARNAEIDEVLTSLPRGYETLLSRVFAGPGGDDDCVLLSGGENQRVALARAMMSPDADLIILDEPSSGLDAEAESRIHRTLREKYGQRTSLLISHRLSTLRESAAIVVLSGGTITERGTHAELMALGGAYARLFDLQAAGYQAGPAGPADPGARHPVASPPVAGDDELFDAIGSGQHG